MDGRYAQSHIRNTQFQQQPSNLEFFEPSFDNNELEQRPHVTAQPTDNFYRLNYMQLLQAHLNSLELSPNLPSSLSFSQPRRQFLDSEPRPTTRINIPATPQTTLQVSPLASATNRRININESPETYYFPNDSPRNLNLPRNLFDEDNDVVIQCSPSHDRSLQYSLFANPQSPGDHYYNRQRYDNGLGSSGLQRRGISSHDHHERYHDHDNIFRRHQYQRFSPFTSMDEVRGNVVMAAKSQHGSRFLQEKLRQGHPENIDMIFSETKSSLCVLMVHQFGHHVVLKLIDVVNDNKIEEILHLLTRDVIRLRQICADDHGTKVLQKLVGRLSTTEQQYLLASALSRIALVLTRSTNGNAVIYQGLKNFAPAYKKLLLRIIAENCLDIAQDKCGCCILQKCFDEADNEIFNIFAAVIIQYAETLSEHCYGNYVVQYVINMKKLEVNRNIVAKFEGKFVAISMNKHGSNVVEKLVKDSGLEGVVELVITEILNSANPLQVSQDLYGNYVVQSAIKVIKDGDLFNKFVKHIEDNGRYLQNHMYGKRVLQAMNARRNG